MQKAPLLQAECGVIGDTAEDAIQVQLMKPPFHPADHVAPGVRFSRLRVEEFVGIVIKGRRKVWRSVCDCGNEVVVVGSELARGNTKSCGCLQRERSQAHRKARRENLTGKPLKHGGKVLGPSDKHITLKCGNRVNLWRCECPCGVEFMATATQIRWKTKTVCRRQCSKRKRKQKAIVLNYVELRTTLAKRDGYKLVSPEDKHAIALAAQRGDKRARELLVMLYDGWCHQVAIRYAKTHRIMGELVVEELVQECRIGLLKALEKWEPERGAFSTCAIWWLRQAMTREPNSGTSSGVVPVHAHTNKTTRVHVLRAHQITSLDKPFGGDDERTFKDMLPDATEAPEFDAKDLDAIPDLLKLLPERQRFVIQRYFFDEKTLQEIGDELGVSRERIRQLVVIAIDKLKRAMARRERPAF